MGLKLTLLCTIRGADLCSQNSKQREQYSEPSNYFLNNQMVIFYNCLIFYLKRLSVKLPAIKMPLLNGSSISKGSRKTNFGIIDRLINKLLLNGTVNHLVDASAEFRCVNGVIPRRWVHAIREKHKN